MEEWVGDWLREKRRDGERGIEIKKFGNSYYVYRSTTFWDRKSNKRRKKSIYLGKLDKERGFIRKREVPHFRPRDIRQFGNAMLLSRSMEGILPLLKEAFRDSWQEIYALSMIRILGYVPLKRVGSM